MNWQDKINTIGTSAGDATQNAIHDDLNFFNVQPLSREEIASLRSDIEKLVRQTVRSRFVPKTHMDI